MRSAAGCAAVLAAVSVAPCPVSAQTDEIQVYDASLAAPGVLNLTLHDNYTPAGRSRPEFVGGVTPRGSLNGVPEWAYGATPWMEAGLYMPLYTYDASKDRFELDGFKFRALFAVPHADERNLFYGVNFEFSVNAKHWEGSRYAGEIRPILGARSGPWTVIFNPILDTDYSQIKKLDFAPAARVSYRLSRRWSLAAEEYDDWGAVQRLSGGSRAFHELFGVVDYTGAPVSVEVGAGLGFTRASDGLTLKLILSKDIG